MSIRLAEEFGQKYMSVTYDLAIANITLTIQSEGVQNMIIYLSSLAHFILNYLSLKHLANLSMILVNPNFERKLCISRKIAERLFNLKTLQQM